MSPARLFCSLIRAFLCLRCADLRAFPRWQSCAVGRFTVVSAGATATDLLEEALWAHEQRRREAPRVPLVSTCQSPKSLTASCKQSVPCWYLWSSEKVLEETQAWVKSQLDSVLGGAAPPP